MEKWQSNLSIALIAIVGLQLASADIDRIFYREPVTAPEKPVVKTVSSENQVQVVSKNATIKSEPQSSLKTSGNEVAVGSSDHGVVAAKTGSQFTLADLNAMNAKDLEQINGIGPVLAERIIAYRQKNGPFATLDALNAVKGIGPKKLEKIKEQIQH